MAEDVRPKPATSCYTGFHFPHSTSPAAGTRRRDQTALLAGCSSHLRPFSSPAAVRARRRRPQTLRGSCGSLICRRNIRRCSAARASRALPVLPVLPVHPALPAVRTARSVRAVRAVRAVRQAPAAFSQQGRPARGRRSLLRRFRVCAARRPRRRSFHMLRPACGTRRRSWGRS